jgi:O-methyltransferase
MLKRGFMDSITKAGKKMLPGPLKGAIKRNLGWTDSNRDVSFRICSPATPPELAQCVFELHQRGFLEGKDYYEFGLFRGYALWFVQDMVRRLDISDFHFHGFDSFAGLPEPVGIDKGEWSAGQFAVSKEQVERYLTEYAADFSTISLHEGFFSDQLFADLKNRVSFRHAALILVDCDLYSSTVPVLHFIANYLVEGTILLFDDYNCFKAADDRGQRRALKEFLQKYPGIHVEPLRPFGCNGQGFHIKRTKS